LISLISSVTGAWPLAVGERGRDEADNPEKVLHRRRSVSGEGEGRGDREDDETGIELIALLNCTGRA
jgi:hypothetical protein